VRYTFRNIFAIWIIIGFNSFVAIAQISISKKDSTVVRKSEFCTKDNEYGAFIHNGDFYFTSDRPLKVGNLTWNDDFGIPTNIFKAKIKDSVNFGKVIPVNKINTKLNEGPICFTNQGAYFSGNKKVNRKIKQSGIPSRIYYISSLEDTAKALAIEIDFNLSDSVSISHPAILNDTLMFFTYYKKLSNSGTDIYCSSFRNQVWSTPVKCNSFINSNKDECFPTINNGKLYFSSNREGSMGMLDLYGYDFQTSETKQLTLFNSEKDDFHILFTNENSGYFSSNRNGNDDIYKFNFSEKPKFDNCVSQEFNAYCYNFKELNDFESKDTLNMIYEWDFGDGSKQRGLCVDHCFSGEGKYEIKLNVIQKSSGEFFDNELNYDLDVTNIKQLYISCYDTVSTNTVVSFNSEYSNIENFKMEKYFWQIDGVNEYFEGNSFNFSFSKEGNYRIKLLVEGKENETEKFHCVYRDITVKENYQSNSTMRVPLKNLNR